METFDLEAILVDSVSGNNEKMQNSVSLFNEAEKNLPLLLSAFLHIINESENNIAVFAAYINLSTLLSNRWSDLTDEQHDEIRSFFINIVPKVNEGNLMYFSQIILMLLKHYFNDSQLVYLLKNTPLHEHYLLELLSRFDAEDEKLILASLESICRIILHALKTDTLHYKLLAMHIMAYVIELFPAQTEFLGEHFEALLVLSKSSLTMTENDFIQVWKKMNLIFYVDPIEYIPFNNFVPVILTAAERKDIRPECRIHPLMCFQTFLTDLAKEDLLKMAMISIDTAIDYVKYCHKNPSDFLFFYNSFFETFEHDMLYNFIKKLIISMMESDDFPRKIVAICLIKNLVEHLPHQIYNDIKMATSYIEFALKQTDPLYLEVALSAIIKFTKFFTWNLVDPELYLPIIIPLLLHNDPNINFLALEASLKCFQISNAPVRGAVRLLEEIAPSIPPENTARFLYLLSEGIKHQIMFEKDQSDSIIKLVLSVYSSTSDLEVLYSTQCISTNLMINCDYSKPALIGKVVSTTRSCFEADDALSNILSLISLCYICTIDKALAFEIIAEYSHVIIQLIMQENEQFEYMKRYILRRIARIDSLFEETCSPFHEALVQQCLQWLNSDNQANIISSLKSIQYLIRSMSEQEAALILQHIADLCLRTKSRAAVCKIIQAAGGILKRAKEDQKEGIFQIAHIIANCYIEGNLTVLEGVPPMTTDIDMKLFYPISKLMRILLTRKHPNNSVIFKFLTEVFSRFNTLNNLLISKNWAVAVSCDTLLPEEVKYVKDVALALFNNDVAPELVLGASELLLSLYKKEIISSELARSKISVLMHWWNRFSIEPHKMRKTMSCIVLLIWAVNMNMLETEFPEDLVPASLEFYPPDDFRQTAEMTSLLLEYFRTCKNIDLPKYISGAVALARLLIRPPLVLVKRGMTPEMLSNCETVLDDIRKIDPSIQNAVNEFANQNVGRRELLKKFIC